MRFVKYIMKRFIRDEKKVLGRWNLEYCDIRLKNKIELSNEDHCGCCRQYISHKSDYISDKYNYNKYKIKQI